MSAGSDNAGSEDSPRATVRSVLAWTIRSIVNDPTRTLLGSVVTGAIIGGAAYGMAYVPRGVAPWLGVAGAVTALIAGTIHSRHLARRLGGVAVVPMSPSVALRIGVFAAVSVLAVYAGGVGIAHYLVQGSFQSLLMAVVTTWVWLALVGISVVCWPAVTCGTAGALRYGLGAALVNVALLMRLATVLVIVGVVSAGLVVVLFTLYPAILQLAALRAAVELEVL